MIGFAAKETNFGDATVFADCSTFNQGDNFMPLIPPSAAPLRLWTCKELRHECFPGYRGMFSI